MNERKLNSTTRPIGFLLVSSTDHISPVTGLGSAPVVTISKNGGSFGPASGVVSEIANGWYSISAVAGDRDTLGDCAFHVTASGADPCDFRYEIVAYDPFDAAGLGLTNLDTNVGSRNAIAPATPANVTAARDTVLTEVDLVKSKTDNLPADPASDTQVNTRLATTDYTAPPAASAISDYMDAHSTKLSNLNATITSRADAPGLTTAKQAILDAIAALPTPANTDDVNTIEEAIQTVNDLVRGLGGWASITQASAILQAVQALSPQVASAVWNEALADHTVNGSAGAVLALVGGAADPLASTVPGSYPPGTLGYFLGTKLMLIGAALVQVFSPMVTGSRNFSIIRGDYYPAGRVSWQSDSAGWRDYIGKPAVFTARYTDNQTLSVPVEFADVDGMSTIATLGELTSAVTADLAVGNGWVGDVQATVDAGEDVTVIPNIRMTVLRDVSPSSGA